MHRAFLLLAATALSLPAFAEDTPKTTSADHKPRLTWQQHFDQANAAHDGHLTLEEAKAGYPSIVRSFDEIDVGHKGYLTEDDISAWHQARRAAHKLNPPPSPKPAPKSSWETTPSQPTTKVNTSVVDASPVSWAGARN